jgi:hypothetical protein
VPDGQNVSLQLAASPASTLSVCCEQASSRGHIVDPTTLTDVGVGDGHDRIVQ